jgi:hypothetical protein
MSTSGIRERVRNKSKNDSDILNLILEFMLKQATLADFYSVADPSRCKNYVLAGKEALLKLFVSLQIQPMKGKDDGVLYFQRIDGLKDGMPPELVEAQKRYCLELSFFFIRIFQIFGALTLSVMDVTIPSEVGEALSGRRAPVGKSYVGAIPGFGPQKGGVLQGAWVIPDDNSYSILNKYISRPSTSTPNQLRFSNYDDMYVNFESMYSGTIDHPILRTGDDFRPFIFYNFNNESHNTGAVGGRLILRKNGDKIILDMNTFSSTASDGKPIVRTVHTELTQFANGRFLKNNKELPAVIHEIMKSVAPPPAFSIVRFFKDLRYIVDTMNDEREQPIRDTKIVILPNQPKTPVLIRYREDIRIKRDEREVKVQLVIDGCTLSITPHPQTSGLMLEFTVRVGMEGRRVTPTELASSFEFKQYKESIFKRTQDGYDPINDKGQTIPVYVQGIFKNIIEHREEAEGRGPKFKRTQEGYIVPWDSDNIPGDMRIKKLWESLTADPPVKAFCTARAMQLLSPAALEGAIPAEVLTSICRTTFAYQSNGSVGKVGKSIEQIHGVRAMAAIFVDTIQNGLPRVNDSEKYKEFLRAFKTMFERVDVVPPAGPASLAEINERAPPFCPPGEDSRGYITDRSLVSKLRSKALELIERQLVHTGNVMKIISKLFTVEGNGQVLFNASVKTRGIPYIDSVAAEARELLLRYYSDCEMKYSEGLQTLAGARASIRFAQVKEVVHSPVTRKYSSPI